MNKKLVKSLKIVSIILIIIYTNPYYVKIVYNNFPEKKL